MTPKDPGRLLDAGLSFSEIGERLGVTRQTAHEYLGRALGEYRRVIAEETDTLRASQLARGEQAILSVWPRVAEEDLEAGRRLQDGR